MLLPGFAAMLTLTGNDEFTVIEMALDVAGLPVAHVSFEVSTHVTLFPLANVLLE
jgi:hypothetical protein